MIQIVVQVIAVWLLMGCAVLPFVVLARLLTTRTRPQRSLAVLIGAGYLAGALGVWALRPIWWSMTIWQTMHASVHADLYGHVVEHQAENILVFMMLGAVLGSALAALTVAAVNGLEHRRRATA